MHGREIDRPIAKWKLQKGMRLTPAPDLLNVAELDNFVSDFPPGGLHLVFWHSDKCCMVLNRNPLFSEETGVTIEMICVDFSLF